LGNSNAAVKGELAGARSALQMAIRHPDRVTAPVLMVPLAQAAYAGGFPASAGALGRCENFRSLRWRCPEPNVRINRATALRWVWTGIADQRVYFSTISARALRFAALFMVQALLFVEAGNFAQAPRLSPVEGKKSG